MRPSVETRSRWSDDEAAAYPDRWEREGDLTVGSAWASGRAAARFIRRPESVPQSKPRRCAASGHASARTTEDIYQHVTAGMQGEATARVAALLRT
jgi:hypothetical protein